MDSSACSVFIKTYTNKISADLQRMCAAIARLRFYGDKVYRSVTEVMKQVSELFAGGWGEGGGGGQQLR